MRRCKYLTSTILCTLILNACGDKTSNETNPSSTVTLSPEVISTSVTVPSAQPAETSPSVVPKEEKVSPSVVPKEGKASPKSVKPTSPAKELEATKGSVVYSKKHVIVNAANKWLAPGGGVSGAIFGAAGEDKVLAEIKSTTGKSNKLMAGTDILLRDSEVFTTGAYDLSKHGTQYIIHALGPIFTAAPKDNPAHQKGYIALRTTYQNVYNEMDRLNKETGVTTIGVVPISADLFAGNADKDQIFRIMIEETLDAMSKYPDLQPELYLFTQPQYDAVKRLLPSIVAEKYPSAAGASLSAGTAAAVLALNSNPSYQASIGNGYIKGSAHDLGPIRLIGLNSDYQHHSTNTAFIGIPLKQHMVGVELEWGYHRNELTHSAVKAKGIYQFSPEICLGAGVGYLNTNLSSNVLNANMQQFLNQFGITNLSYQTITAEMAAQYQKSITENTHLTTTIGFQMKFDHKMVTAPFAQVSINIGQLKSNLFTTMEDIGFNLELNN